jgi:tetratricopeptide (TPR) repeat protein
MGDGLSGGMRAALAGGDVDALVEVGCDLADEGRQADALTCFQRAVALGADWVWFNVGNTLRELGHAAEAAEAYRRAADAGETDAWFSLGHLLESHGDLEGAAGAFRSAGVVGEPGGFVELAQLLRDRGDDTAADAALALALAGDHPPALALRASWDWERTADPALEERLRAGARVSGAARADLAALLLLTERREEAQRQLELGAKLGQRECWLPLGNLLAESDVDAAEEAYGAGIAAGDVYCHHNLAVLLLERGDTDRARSHLAAGAATGDDMARRALRELGRD